MLFNICLFTNLFTQINAHTIVGKYMNVYIYKNIVLVIKTKSDFIQLLKYPFHTRVVFSVIVNISNIKVEEF